MPYASTYLLAFVDPQTHIKRKSLENSTVGHDAQFSVVKAAGLDWLRFDYDLVASSRL
ncbi:MAG: hypothetical protein WAV20_21425 [Blastocatellia bacterium]